MRKENQDSALAIGDYRSGDEALFGVFDGHGPNGQSAFPAFALPFGLSLATLEDVSWAMRTLQPIPHQMPEAHSPA